MCPIVKSAQGRTMRLASLPFFLRYPRAPDRPDPLGVRSHEVHRTVVNKDRVGGRNAPAPARHQKHQATRLRTPLAQRMHVSAGHQAVHNMVKLQRFKHGPGIVARTVRKDDLASGKPLHVLCGTSTELDVETRIKIVRKAQEVPGIDAMMPPEPRNVAP